LLEIGCGNGGMTRMLATRVSELVALDISTQSLAVVESMGLPNVRTVAALVENYEPEEQYDWIVMSEVLEHLRRPVDVVQRIAKWLAPGGSLLITTPNGHWESNEHLQEFDLPGFSRLLAESGQESISASYLRDVENRRRWLVGQVWAPRVPPAKDDFNDHRSTARRRRVGK
jgi:2-polyprenyl-3-methyl-5-hydroxy-6-metoxy-1,4-benzoquinol methylase